MGVINNRFKRSVRREYNPRSGIGLHEQRGETPSSALLAIHRLLRQVRPRTVIDMAEVAGAHELTPVGSHTV